MRKHLASRHKSVMLEGPASGSCSLPRSRQTQLNFGQRSLTTAQQESFTRKIALMCAIDLKPISIVEGSGFKFLVHSLNPSYRVPCRKTVSKYLEKIYNEHKEEIIDCMRGKVISLTSDMWTSAAVQGFITVTGHFIQDWELKNIVMATRIMTERHTGVNIGTTINQICEEFSVGRKLAVVTDNASNMSIAAAECDALHVTCFAHTLQLAIEDGLKIEQISKTLSVSRKLVGHFSHSPLALNALLEKQGGEKKLKLVQDVSTRWNSSFAMMERLLKLRIPVYSVIFDENITKPGDRVKFDIRDNYWKVMEDTVPILGPLAAVTEMLGREDTPTGSSVLVVLYNLINGPLKQTPGESQVAKSLKVKIRDGLKKRFHVNDEGKPKIEGILSPLIVACLLDPRYKSILGRDLLDQTDMALLQGHILDLMSNIDLSSSVSNNEDVSSTACDLTQNSELISWAQVIQGDVKPLEYNDRVSAAEELNDYMADIVRDSNPLTWWKSHEIKYPRLAKLAQEYLSVPATSIPSERTFSVAGLTVSNLRTALDPDSVDQIIFVNKNLKSEIRKQVESFRSLAQNETAGALAAAGENLGGNLDSEMEIKNEN